MDDELNNQNPNGTNNPYQGQDSFASMNPDFNANQNTNQDPYSSMNPDFNTNQNASQDPYASMSPDTNAQFNNMDDSVLPGNDNNQVLNPILSQSMPSNNASQSTGLNDTNYQGNNFSDPNMNYQDNNFSDPNMNYQDNNFSDPNMNYQNNNFGDPNMNYQDNSFSDPNMNYQNNNFGDPNMNYQDNNFSDPNMNYQDNNFSDPNINYQNNNFSDPNMNYQNNNFSNSNMNQDYNTAFVQTWMGNLYEKAHSKKFNWCAAIFGEIYLLYRKMYLTGILFSILKYLLVFLSAFLIIKIGAAALAILSIISLAFIMIYGFGFYPLYRNFVKSKLDKFKQTTTDNQQLVNLASQKGGTSPIAVVVFCIVVPIIISSIVWLLIGAGILNLANSFLGAFNELSNTVNNEIANEESLYDYQYWNFEDNYSIQYDSLVWFFDETDSSLAKGNYKLTYSGQSIKNINATYGYDMTSITGRSSLLSNLISSFEAQATSLNVTVQPGSSNFVTGTSLPNIYYSYIDIESAETLYRYYLVLIPEDDILFQFILTVDDTSVDSMTNADVIGILTSVSKTEETTDTTGNAVSEQSANIVDENVVVSNEINDENTNEVIENSTTNNTLEGNTTSYGNEVITSVTNTLSGENSTLGEFLR